MMQIKNKLPIILEYAPENYRKWRFKSKTIDKQAVWLFSQGHVQE